MSNQQMNHGVSHSVGRYNGFAGEMTQRAMVMEVLNDLGRPTDAQAVETAVRSRYPEAVIARGSIPAMLSNMSNKGEVKGELTWVVGGHSRRLYGALLPASGSAVPNARVDKGPADSALPQSETNVAPAPCKQPAKKEVSISVSPSLCAAILALGERRNDRVRGGKAIAFMVDSILRQFLASAPYADEHSDFFWTKFVKSGEGATDLRLPLSSSTESIYDQLTVIKQSSKQSSALVKRGIARDGGQRSDSSQLTLTMIGHTALVWHLVACTNDDERSIPAIAAFLQYAATNYVSDGRDVTSAYPPIHPAMGDAGHCDGGVSTPEPDGLVPDGLVPDGSGPDGSGPQYGLSMAADGTGGLRISIHLPPALIERLLCSTIDALDSLTRARHVGR